MDNDLRAQLILAYRDVIAQRYQLDNLREQFDIPDYVDEKKVDDIRNYFLEYIYPHPQQRESLDAAFDSLRGHIRHPQQLLTILRDSASILLKYGRHLPKILNAGINALKSFTTASSFEKKMILAAEEQDIQPPISSDDVKALISTIDRKNIDAFMDESLVLFEILYDRKLVNRIIHIVEHLISKMKKKPKVYAQEEVDGLEIGRAVIVEGVKIFDTLSEEEQRLLFDKVVEIERHAIDEIYSSTES